MSKNAELYPHYYKAVPYKVQDVYRLLDTWGIADPCIQHALKKLLVAGQRGAKDAVQDVNEARHTLERWLEMREEDATTATPAPKPDPLVQLINDEMRLREANKMQNMFAPPSPGDSR